MTKITRNLTQLKQQNSNLWLSKRLLYANPTAEVKLDQTELENKIRSNQDKQIQALSSRIAFLETKNASDPNLKQKIKDEMQKEKDRIFREAVNQALIDLKLTKSDGKTQATYEDLMVLPSDKAVIDSIQKKFSAPLSTDIDKAVDAYFVQKTIKATGISGALGSLPPATVKQDLDSDNPEIRRLQEVKAGRDKIKAESKKSRKEIIENIPISAASLETRANKYVDVDSDNQYHIDNYDTKLFSSENNSDNPLKNKYAGLLYANFVFFGGGKAGDTAMESAAKQGYEAHKAFKNRLNKKDLEVKLGMGTYLDQASEYSTEFKGKKNDRVVGMIAGIFKLADENISDPAQKKKYLEDLQSKLDEVKGQNSERKQLDILVTVKPVSEYLEVSTDWRAKFNAIDKLTDPKQPGARIDDYPGTGKADRDNKTRWNLNGYLYANYLFKGQGKDGSSAVNSEYERAVKMFKDSGVFDEDFTQDHIEKDYVDKNNKKEGFGLKEYLDEASSYTELPQAQGAVAGLLKLCNDKLGGTKRTAYKAYLLDKFKQLASIDKEDGQLMFLSSIKSPEQAGSEVLDAQRGNLIDLMIEASKQHNQLVFKDPTIVDFQSANPSNANPDYQVLAKNTNDEIKNFIKSRSDKAINEKVDGKDNPDGMLFKMKLLRENNAKLATPLYATENLLVLNTSIEDLNKKFDEARAVNASGNLAQTLSEKYLQKLSEAEKIYFSRANELDEKLKAVEEASKAPKAPTVIGGGAPTGPGAVPIVVGPEKPAMDKIETEWEKSKDVEPLMKDFSGTVITKTAKVTARDDNGHPATTFNQGYELFRTYADAEARGRKIGNTVFVKVSDGENSYWIAENLLIIKESKSEPVITPEKTPQVTPEKVGEKPGPRLQSYFDVNIERIRTEVETNPLGTTFDLIFNGKALPCRYQKLADGYHLTYQNEEVAGNILLGNTDQMRAYVEDGHFTQYTNTQMLQDQKSWDRYKDSSWVDEAVEVKRTGPYSVFIELDWKRNYVTETGNAKVDLMVGPDGRINYSIKKDYVGADGGPERVGFVSDMTQLIEVLSHCKVWSENYLDNQSKPEFNSIANREMILASLMDNRNYEAAGLKIGEKYYFQNFYNRGAASMELNWENKTDLYDRNRSVKNPRLEVFLNPDNTLSYRLTNRTGPNAGRVGCFGQATDMTQLFNVVALAKNSPEKYMITPIQNMSVSAQFPPIA